jgi:hypothetical protein
VLPFQELILERLEANEYAPAGARPGLLIDGPATVGKSTLVKMIARKFELGLRKDYPERFATDRFGDYVTVVYLSVPDTVTPKQISLAPPRYLQVPVSKGKDAVDERSSRRSRRCGVQMLIIENLHFLDCSFSEAGQVHDPVSPPGLAPHRPPTEHVVAVNECEHAARAARMSFRQPHRYGARHGGTAGRTAR